MRGLLWLWPAAKAKGMLVGLAVAAVAASPDPTGINGALQRLATLLAGLAGGAAALALAIIGLMYMFVDADNVGRATHLRRAAWGVVVGLILVVLAATIAPQLVATIAGTPGTGSGH
ncbi:TrbC/VirB2 family protein [Thermogemmatispora sp.]|uniref:TrbC/VirB2 family protein n=1 Tax=Thermogemmatispora sp. TaxID=1968838 RepID=UPI0035E400C3